MHGKTTKRNPKQIKRRMIKSEKKNNHAKRIQNKR